MKFSLSRRGRPGIGLALLVAGIAGASAYVSAPKIEVNITSRISGLITVFVCLVLPLYRIIITREIAQRRRAEEKFRGLQEADLDAMVVVNRAGEVLEEIKESPPLKSILFVILTTSASDADILRTYRLHANCYVTKPVDLDGFLKVAKSIDNFWLSAVRLPREART
jgi:CheY-like chemotaxis protein